MTDDWSGYLARFVDELAADGDLPDPAWRRAFAEVPRHLFLPRYFVPLPDGRWQGIDATHPAYRSMVYADTTLTTQLDGAIEPDPAAGPVAGTGTSSSTQPSLMAAMLRALYLGDHERVLEIGTGTGYNAALLCHRLGDDLITTVEVDPAVANQARRRLDLAGYQPDVIVGDGQQGAPDNRPYDRIIATCSVPVVPVDWIAQVRDDGLIVTSLWRDLGGAPLVRLAVRNGVAEGRFRPHRAGSCRYGPPTGRSRRWRRP